MSLKLLIDEDSQDKRLVKFLREAGHDVTTANEAGLMSQPDLAVLGYACLTNRVLLTLNCRDFEALHEVSPNHPGILAVYQDADPLKKMSFAAIAKAIAKRLRRRIANLEAASIPLASQFIPLNQWNY